MSNILRQKKDFFINYKNNFKKVNATYFLSPINNKREFAFFFEQRKAKKSKSPFFLRKGQKN